MKLEQACEKVYMTHGLSIVGSYKDEPVVWDVMNDAPLLIVNLKSNKLDKLFVILDTIRISLEQYNIPQILQITWFTKRDEPYNPAITRVVRLYERDFEKTLHHFADLVNRRGVGQNRGALQLLMIDDLWFFAESEYEARRMF